MTSTFCSTLARRFSKHGGKTRTDLFRAVLITFLALGLCAIFLRTVFAGSGVAVEPRVRPHPPATSAARYNLQVQSNLVLVPVTVTDSSDHFVAGLSKENFRIFEENQPQEILSFSSEDAPASVGLVFDCSASMKPKMNRAREAATAFFRVANPEDEFFLVEFNERAKLIEGFTRDAPHLEALISSAKASGSTALLDGIYLALHQMALATNPRKALLLISDGGDNHSRYTQRELKNVLRESGVQVYAMGIYGILLR